jgi:hypothetical protein
MTQLIISQDGLFHANVIMKLEISSPHFKSKKSSEEYEVFVMRHKVSHVLPLQYYRHAFNKNRRMV